MSEVVISELSSKNKTYKGFGFLLGVFLIYSFTTDMNWGKLFMGVIFLLFSIYNKKVVAKEDGIHFTNTYFIFNKHKTIKYDDLKEIVIVEARRDNLIFLVEENARERVFLSREKIYEMKEFIQGHSDVKIRFEHKMPEDMP